MKEKEKELTRRIGLYFARGGGDGDLYEQWLSGWTDDDIAEFEQDFAVFNGEGCPMLNLPISSIFEFLLSRL